MLSQESIDMNTPTKLSFFIAENLYTQFDSINVTMETKTANHILTTAILTTMLAILLSAAPTSTPISHAEVSARGIPYKDELVNV